MNKATLVGLALALAVPATSVLSQQKDEMKCEDMKGMDMKGMDMKGMNCADMMKGGDTKGMGMGMDKKPGGATDQVHVAKGMVTKVDAAAGTVTVAHEPVQSMQWPAMSMGFKVKDNMLLDKLADGKKVEFEFMQEGKDYVITRVK